MHFPPELADRFIDNLHDDRHTLATCALVSKTWTPASRYHLFRHVVLAENSWMDFLRLLASPFATFTPHSVRIITPEPNRPLTPLLNDIVPKLASLLDDIVPKLPHLPAVTFVHLWNLDWRDISPPTVTSLAALFVQITALDIGRVYLRDVHEFARVVSLFHRLEEMSIHPSFRNDHPQVAPFPGLPRGLVHVALSWSGRSSVRDMFMETLPWLEGTSTQPSPVQSLRLTDVPAAALPALGRLLRVLGPQLQVLDVRFRSWANLVTPDNIDDHVDLSENPNLRDLTVHAYSDCISSWGLMFAVRAPLRTLTIELFLDTRTTLALDDFDWDILASLLSKRPHFAALQRLHLILAGWTSIDTVELHAAVRARVAECDARGIVDVDISPYLLGPGGRMGQR
ncbi:hypothetical protein C8R46DRAFT_1192939 [Mycena filopes]|nr:hypothetical protein C8R46DRAFT_1192939 [Mycena filopes]